MTNRSKKTAKKIKLEYANSKQLNTVVGSANNIDESFVNLSKKSSIKDENILKVYHNIAVTGKIV